MKILWRSAYFSTGFGEAVLAIAAWTNGDQDNFHRHVHNIGTEWRFLNSAVVHKLREIGHSAGGEVKKELWGRIAAAQPVKWLNSLIDQGFSAESLSMLKELTPAAYMQILRHAAASPSRSLKKVLNLGRRSHPDSPT